MQVATEAERLLSALSMVYEWSGFDCRAIPCSQAVPDHKTCHFSVIVVYAAWSCRRPVHLSLQCSNESL